jgi:hypothetical protein
MFVSFRLSLPDLFPPLSIMSEQSTGKSMRGRIPSVRTNKDFLLNEMSLFL